MFAVHLNSIHFIQFPNGTNLFSIDVLNVTTVYWNAAINDKLINLLTIKFHQIH